MNSARDPAVAEREKKRLRKRYRAELRFRSYGVAAIVFAIASLALLLVSVISEALPAFAKYELRMPVTLDAALVDKPGARNPADIRSNIGGFSEAIRANLRARFPEAGQDHAAQRQLYRLVSTLAAAPLAERTAAHPETIGASVPAHVAVSDVIDLYLKGLATPERVDTAGVGASATRGDGKAAISAPGAFAEARARIAAMFAKEADAKEAAARQSETQMTPVSERLAGLQARRNGLASGGAEAIRAAADEVIANGAAEETELARAAGRVSAGGDASALIRRLAADFDARAAVAKKESDDLIARGQKFSGQSKAAAARGEPQAETRRLQAEAAFLAGDRRQADKALAEAMSADFKSGKRTDAVVAAELLLGRPLSPLGLSVGAADPAAKLAAVARINAAEIVAADAQIADQTLRVTALDAVVKGLKVGSPDRAKALEAGALASAKSRVTRLENDRSRLQGVSQRLAQMASGAPLQVPAPAPAAAPTPDAAAPATPPKDDASFLAEEAAGQLGLDNGGPVAMAFARGQAEAGVAEADAALKNLVLGRFDLDIASAQRDLDRLARKRDRLLAEAKPLRDLLAQPSAALQLTEFTPSLLVEINGGVVKAKTLSPDRIEGEELIAIKGDSAAASTWRIRELETAEADRLVTDRQAAWANALKASGDIVRIPNWDLLTRADSTYPELAGLAAALAGSFWIMVATLLISLPVGVMAAIYLQEFAPRNRLTDFIEVNINNLAAVPSIVFGLLGAAVFINFFHLPRSAPLVGGLVLSLITLPTIIIATRSALGAVPPSIREGALAVGASLPQTVFHHVLPLAGPGIMTGAIIGLARALGETAPLLLIGMVAFVADPPASMLDSGTALPVLVYKWAGGAERAWQPITSAAIIVLLVFMFAMNALAVWLRRRLERRW